MTIAERMTRQFIIRKISGKTESAINSAIQDLQQEFGPHFSQAFKTITSDNGSEFAELATLEQNCDTKVYFTHPYSSFERGTNERHNGLIRRFIPKGNRIDAYTVDEISFIENWSNTLPRKILGYSSPEELFEGHLDKIYAI